MNNSLIPLIQAIIIIFWLITVLIMIFGLGIKEVSSVLILSILSTVLFSILLSSLIEREETK